MDEQRADVYLDEMLALQAPMTVNADGPPSRRGGAATRVVADPAPGPSFRDVGTVRRAALSTTSRIAAPQDDTTHDGAPRTLEVLTPRFAGFGRSAPSTRDATSGGALEQFTRYGFRARPAAMLDDDEPLLFTMSELGGGGQSDLAPHETEGFGD